MKLEIRDSDGQVLLVGNDTPLHGGTITEIANALLPVLTGDDSYADYKWDGTQFTLNKAGNIHRLKEKADLVSAAKVIRATLVALKKLNPALVIPTAEQIKAEL